MHLKNFSLITEDPSHINLSPAYDLLSVRLLLSEKEDSEELALALNGKKRKLEGKDFARFAENIGINSKVTQMVLRRQISAIPAMVDLIDRSFLSEENRELFKSVVLGNIERIKVM